MLYLCISPIAHLNVRQDGPLEHKRVINSLTQPWIRTLNRGHNGMAETVVTSFLFSSFLGQKLLLFKGEQSLIEIVKNL
jgi:hypothetical protein